MLDRIGSLCSTLETIANLCPRNSLSVVAAETLPVKQENEFVNFILPYRFETLLLIFVIFVETSPIRFLFVSLISN